jgi:hypothetical protein
MPTPTRTARPTSGSSRAVPRAWPARLTLRPSRPRRGPFRPTTTRTRLPCAQPTGGVDHVHCAGRARQAHQGCARWEPWEPDGIYCPANTWGSWPVPTGPAPEPPCSSCRARLEADDLEVVVGKSSCEGLARLGRTTSWIGGRSAAPTARAAPFGCRCGTTTARASTACSPAASAWCAPPRSCWAARCTTTIPTMIMKDPQVGGA